MPTTKRKTGTALARNSKKASARKTPYDKSGAGSSDRVNPLKKPTKSTKRTYGEALARKSKKASTRRSK